jgi:quinol monooxygenase YgiN
MMTIVISGYIKVSAEKREQILLDARQYIEATRLEPGCVAYWWSADLSEPEMIYVFEQWVDEASLLNHFQCSPYQDTLKMFNEAGILESEVDKYRVDLVEPVYDESGTVRADFFTDA